MDLDNAVALRLRFFDIAEQKAQAKLTAYEVSKIFGDGSQKDDDNEFIGGDAYADENTVIS